MALHAIASLTVLPSDAACAISRALRHQTPRCTPNTAARLSQTTHAAARHDMALLWRGYCAALQAPPLQGQGDDVGLHVCNDRRHCPVERRQALRLDSHSKERVLRRAVAGSGEPFVLGADRRPGKVVPGTSWANVFKRVVVDQATLMPLNMALFLAWPALWARDLQKAREDVEGVLWTPSEFRVMCLAGRAPVFFSVRAPRAPPARPERVLARDVQLRDVREGVRNVAEDGEARASDAEKDGGRSRRRPPLRAEVCNLRCAASRTASQEGRRRSLANRGSRVRSREEARQPPRPPRQRRFHSRRLLIAHVPAPSTPGVAPLFRT